MSARATNRRGFLPGAAVAPKTNTSAQERPGRDHNPLTSGMMCIYHMYIIVYIYIDT